MIIISRSEKFCLFAFIIKYPTVDINRINVHNLNFFHLSWNILVKFSNFPNSFQYPLCEGNVSENRKVDFAGTENCTEKYSFERI